MTVLNDSTLYLINNIGEHNMAVCEIDTSEMTIIEEINIENASFITDVAQTEKDIYLLKNRDGNDQLSNQLIKINLKSKQVDMIDLPFVNISKLYLKDKDLYILENSYIGENTQNQIARVHLDTQKIDVFQTDNNHLATDLKDDKLYTTDGSSVYIYSLIDFKLLKQFDLNDQKNMQVVSIFAK